MITIKTSNDLIDWLAEHWNFENARVLNCTATPGPENPQEVVFELAYGIEWNKEPYSRCVSRAFRVRVNDVRSFFYEHPWVCAEDHRMAPFECIEVQDGLSFRLDIPTLVKVACTELEVEELPLIEDIAAPGRFTASVSQQTLPSPQDWLDWLDEQREEVVWHMFRGGPEDVHKVPRDYTGWFLQTRSRLERTERRSLYEEGAFISECKPQESGFRIQIENHGASKELWWEVNRIVAQFQGAVIQCGDCEYNGTDWLQLMRR